MTSETTPLKTCINCLHIATVGSMDWERFKCMAPENWCGVNLVDGHAEYLLPLCKDQRASLSKVNGCMVTPPICGKEATWFKPKPVPEEVTKPLAASVREAKRDIAAGKVSADDL